MTDTGPTVLVVDDDPRFREVIRRILGREGIHILEAGDGEAAVALIDEAPPDVMLVDVALPGRDGLSVLDYVHGSPELSGIPVILITGNAAGADAVAALNRGAHDYLTKPFEPAELLARVRAALRSAALLAELRRRNEELDNFAAVAAHDLKSPLGIVKSTADLLGARWDRIKDETRTELLGTISTAVERAASLITNLLALARAEQVQEGVVAEADSFVVVTGVVKNAALREGDDIQIEGAWVPVAVPEPELVAVLANLVDNAGHYGRSEDGVLRARLIGHVEPAALVIQVTDRGRGIPEESRNRVFEPFVGLPGSRAINPNSTGVGLAIVRKAVERHGGTVSVGDNAPGGTMFTLVLPRVKQSD